MRKKTAEMPVHLRQPSTLNGKARPDTQDELEDWKREDESLSKQLESLLIEFNTEYDSLNQDLVTFIMEHWRNKMVEQLRCLAQKDNETYGASRQSFGVLITTL